MRAAPSKHNRHERLQYLDFLEMQKNKFIQSYNENQMIDSPMHNKNEIMKDQIILQKWEKRLRDWDNIEARLSQKLGNSHENHKRKPSNLMMSMTDDFRLRCEQQDLHQGLIPNEEKNPQSIWLRSLRDCGSRFVPLGNELSGLYAEIEKDQAKFKTPSIIRKPKLMQSKMVTSHTNMMYLEKQDQLFMHDFEPTEDDIRHLTVVSVDLFDWALSSTAAHFTAIDEQEDTIAQLFDEISLDAEDCLLKVMEPTIELSFPTEIELIPSANPDDSTYSSCRIKNTSQIDIQYNCTPKHQSTNIRCINQEGTLPQGTTVDIIFANEYNESDRLVQFQLSTIPPVQIKHVSMSASPYTFAIRSKAALVSPSYSLTSKYNQQTADDVANFMSGIVYSWIDNIRSPVTQLTLFNRKKTEFLLRNRDISLEYDESAVKSLSNEYLQISNEYKHISYSVEKMKAKVSSFLEEAQILQVESSRNSRKVPVSKRRLISKLRNHIIQLDCNKASQLFDKINVDISSLKLDLFPEKSFQPYDEIHTEDLVIEWNYDVRDLLYLAEETDHMEMVLIESELMIEKVHTLFHLHTPIYSYSLLLLYFF